jgi:ABC-2 type transport system permease protein
MSPDSIGVLMLFIITLILALGVTVSFCMLVYILSFFTISPQGIRMVLTGAVELLSGAIIPIPFIPNPFRRVLELLPFASMQNVPLRIYCGNLTGRDMLTAIILQLFWLIMLIMLGKALCKLAERKVVVQGG